MKDKFDLTVIKTDLIAKQYPNPLAYIDHEIDDTLKAVEEFFENSSIEVDYTIVERIAKELDDNGYSYYEMFLFNLV